MRFLSFFLALLALTAIVSLASAQGSEFDDAPVAAPAAAAAAAAAPAAAAPAAAPPSFSSTVTKATEDFFYEKLGLGVIAGYILCYIYGSWKNRQLAQQFKAAIAPLLERDFAKVEDLKKTSASSYDLWASGRRNCKGVLCTLNLQPRQDAVSLLMGMLSSGGASAGPLGQLMSAGGGAAPSTTDTVTFEVPLPDIGVSSRFIFAVLPKAGAKAYLETAKDIDSFTDSKNGKLFRLPEALEVYAEHHELPGKVLSTQLVKLLGGSTGSNAASSSAPAVSLRSLHITDFPRLSGMATAALSPAVLKVEVELPSGPAAAAALAEVTAAVLQLADEVPNVQLTAAAVKAMQASRQEWQRKQEKEKREEQAREEAEKKKEAEEEERKKRKAEEAALLAGLSKEERVKREIKQREREMKEEMARMRKKMTVKGK